MYSGLTCLYLLHTSCRSSQFNCVCAQRMCVCAWTHTRRVCVASGSAMHPPLVLVLNMNTHTQKCIEAYKYTTDTCSLCTLRSGRPDLLQGLFSPYVYNKLYACSSLSLLEKCAVGAKCEELGREANGQNVMEDISTMHGVGDRILFVVANTHKQVARSSKCHWRSGANVCHPTLSSTCTYLYVYVILPNEHVNAAISPGKHDPCTQRSTTIKFLLINISQLHELCKTKVNWRHHDKYNGTLSIPIVCFAHVTCREAARKY